MGNTQGTNTASDKQNHSANASDPNSQQVANPAAVEFNYTEKDLQYLESKEADEAYGEIRIYKVKNSAPQQNPEVQDDEQQNLVEDLEICMKTKIFDSKEDCAEYFSEIENKQRLVHPSLVRLVKCNTVTSSNFCTNIHKVDMAFEYIRHSLDSEILNRFKTKEYFDEATIFDVLEHVLNCISYLGSQGIVHGDIQPRTILMDNDSNFKLTDVRFMTNGMCGYRKHLAGIETECFLAPELLIKLRRQTLVDNEDIDQEKADVFSLGLVGLAMATLSSVDVVYDFDEFLVKEDEIHNLLEVVKQSYSQSLFLMLTSMLNHVERRLDVDSALSYIQQIRDDEFNADEYEKQRFQSDIDVIDGTNTQQQEQQQEQQDNKLVIQLTGDIQNTDHLDEKVKRSPVEKQDNKINNSLPDAQQDQSNRQSNQQQPQQQNKSTNNYTNYSDVELRVREALVRSQQVSIKFENSPLRLFRDQLLADELYVPIDPQQASTSSYAMKSRNNIDSNSKKSNIIYSNNQLNGSHSNGNLTLQQTQPKHIVYQPSSQTQVTYSTQKNLSKKVQQQQQRQSTTASKKWRI